MGWGRPFLGGREKGYLTGYCRIAVVLHFPHLMVPIDNGSPRLSQLAALVKSPSSKRPVGRRRNIDGFDINSKGPLYGHTCYSNATMAPFCVFFLCVRHRV